MSDIFDDSTVDTSAGEDTDTSMDMAIDSGDTSDVDTGLDTGLDTSDDIDTDTDTGLDSESDFDTASDVDAGDDMSLDTSDDMGIDTGLDSESDFDAAGDFDAASDIDAGDDMSLDVDTSDDGDIGTGLDTESDFDAAGDTDAASDVDAGDDMSLDLDTSNDLSMDAGTDDAFDDTAEDWSLETDSSDDTMTDSPEQDDLALKSADSEENPVYEGEDTDGDLSPEPGNEDDAAAEDTEQGDLPEEADPSMDTGTDEQVDTFSEPEVTGDSSVYDGEDVTEDWTFDIDNEDDAITENPAQDDMYFDTEDNTDVNVESDESIDDKYQNLNLDALPDYREDAVRESLREAPPQILDKINENIDGLSVDFTADNEVSHYDPNDKTIRMNEQYDNDEYADVFKHELGHYMDDKLGWPSEDPDFINSVASDVMKYDKKDPSGMVNRDNMLDDLFSNEDAAYDRGVSDILSGMFRNDPDIVERYNSEFVDYYHHSDQYWDYKNNRENEIFANMFNIYSTNNENVVKFVENHFPDTSSQFRRIFGLGDKR